MYFKDTGLRLPPSLVSFHDYIEKIKKRQSIFSSCNGEYVRTLKQQSKHIEVPRAKIFEDLKLRKEDRIAVKKAEHDGSVYSVYMHVYKDDVRRELKEKEEMLEQLIIEDFWEN